jgi:NAD(P)-dependent dehydrogenase (short-subunit alcohol dehydrogenase family)
VRLKGHHAIVTGGGTGIGAAIARALAAEGAKLTLVGRRRDKLEEVGAEDFDALAAPADVTVRAQVEDAFAIAREAQGPITILVNNAGAAAGMPFGKVTPAQWRDMLAVNLDGMFHCCQAALPDLIAAQGGRIVTVASMAGLYGFAYASPYIAAKHGAVGLTRALAAEYAGTGLRVNAVCPGFVDSDMTVETVANIRSKTGRSADDARAELARLNPSGRLIAPEEVAAVLLDLVCSERNGEAVEIA